MHSTYDYGRSMEIVMRKASGTDFGTETPSKQRRTISSVQSTGPSILSYLSYGPDSAKVLPDVRNNHCSRQLTLIILSLRKIFDFKRGSEATNTADRMQVITWLQVTAYMCFYI